jgi:hypothetical protein
MSQAAEAGVVFSPEQKRVRELAREFENAIFTAMSSDGAQNAITAQRRLREKTK